MPTFQIVLTSTDPDADATRELRTLLKRALRSHGFRCIDAVQVSTALCSTVLGTPVT
jgi:hypothetical protein